MASAHTDLVRRHRRIIRYRLQKLNEQRGSNYKLGQKNVDLLFYLNYIRFVKALDAKAQKIALVEGSSEVMSEHWEASGKALLDRFEKEGKLN
jgi:hypothetical protein